MIGTLRDAQSAGFCELAEWLEMAKSTVHVHFKSLEE
ncbi:ArsR family transcriptional regulator [Natronomonas sp.]